MIRLKVKKNWFIIFGMIFKTRKGKEREGKKNNKQTCFDFYFLQGGLIEDGSTCNFEAFCLTLCGTRVDYYCC